MAGLEDLGRKGALRVLAALLRQDPEPMDAMDFAAAADMAPNTAVQLRLDLALLGLVDSKVVREQGAIREHRIQLTPAGREAARVIIRLEEILRTAGTPPRSRNGR